MSKSMISLFALGMAVLLLPLYAAAQSTDYAFVFLDFPAEVQMEAGSSKIMEVAVKNIGDYGNTVSLELETTAPISASVVPGSIRVERGLTGKFTLSLLSSPSDAINKYQSKLALKGIAVDLVKEFTITILPSQAKKSEINNNYLVLSNNYESLKKRFDQIRDSGCVVVQPGDAAAVTPAQVTDSLEKFHQSVEKTGAAIKADDFVAASLEIEKVGGLTGSIENKINALKSAQESCEDDKSRVSGYLAGGMVATGVSVVIIVVILGIFTYRYYTRRLPGVRRLIRSGATPPSASRSVSQESQHKAVTHVEREFRYEFRKKK